MPWCRALDFLQSVYHEVDFYRVCGMETGAGMRLGALSALKIPKFKFLSLELVYIRPWNTLLTSSHNNHLIIFSSIFYFDPFLLSSYFYQTFNQSLYFQLLLNTPPPTKSITMQFITIITVLFATVSSVIAIPSPSENEMNVARDLGTSIAERSIGSTICKGAVSCHLFFGGGSLS